MSWGLDKEEEDLFRTREFVCKLIFLVFQDLKMLCECQNPLDNVKVDAVSDWPKSGIHQMYICIYDSSVNDPKNEKSIFRDLLVKYDMPLNYSTVYRRLDPMYRRALEKVNSFRTRKGLDAYPIPGAN